MPFNSYNAELANLESTYADARSRDIERLKTAIAGASTASIVSVGSGGSFTVASLLCGLHEAYTGRVSRPATPLELICNPTLASASPAFLISAEGKNPDIVESLRRARTHSSRLIHVITNRSGSALADAARSLSNVNLHAFELAEKDGYLATNSLLFDSVIVARAYGDFGSRSNELPKRLDELLPAGTTFQEYLAHSKDFSTAVAQRGAVIVLYSPQLRAVATDLESKLSEAALVHCQIADLRSFAHGRHLWLAERPHDCAVLALTEPSLQGLWEGTRQLLPDHVPVLNLQVGGSRPCDLISGLVFQMYLVSQIAQVRDRDPGNPDVPAFGRNIHYIDLPKLVPPPSLDHDEGESSKFAILGANWSTYPRGGTMKRALTAFKEQITTQRFRAVVFDYDGTLCYSQSGDSPPPKVVLDHVGLLVEKGITVGIASGRGGSIQEFLAAELPDIAGSITLGLYNGGWIGNASQPPVFGQEHSEFISHATRVSRRLKDIGVPIAVIRTTQPFQVSLRLYEGADSQQIWFVIADALRQEGLDVLRVVRSNHSVDILSPTINKASVTRHIIQDQRIDPYAVLTIGDHGAWPGNDASLLEHRFSLSVDQPSRLLDRGWKLAPANKRQVDATVWYLDHFRFHESGYFGVSFELPEMED